MAFIDFLAFQESLLLLAAVIVGYVGFSVWFAMRRNDSAGVKAALRAGSIPIGAIGIIATVLAVWAEETWPFPAIPNTNMASYNVFFTDVYLLFGLTLVILAVSMAFHFKLAFAGLFAFVAGSITASYGWNGYILHMTKDPLETFLMYLAFAGVGIFAFPATVFVDHFLAHPDGTAFAFSLGTPVARSRPSIQSASRAAQPVVPGIDPEASATAPTTAFHLPKYVTGYVWFFLAVVALAGYAAMEYLIATLPGHLISAP
jgi:uncharacterized membrane protein